MTKRNLGSSFDIYPMPVVIVGTLVDGQPNFMTAAWFTKLCFEPLLVGVSIGHQKHTVRGIRQTREFSLNFPAVDQAILADYCGLVHGHEENKAVHVDMFSGQLDGAPMVRQCPVNVECRLMQTVTLPKNYLFVGEVVNVYADEEILTDGAIDAAKLRPLVFTLLGGAYWHIGEFVGQAWDIGKHLLTSKKVTDDQ